MKEDIKNKIDGTVCLLNDSFPPLIDGVANAVLNYGNYISNNGGSTVVITPDHPEADDKKYQYPIMRYPSIDIRKKVGYMAGIPFSPDIARQLKGKNVKLLHSHCPVVSTMFARQLRQIVDAPLILTYHTKFDIDIANIIKNKALQSGSKKILLENINACDEIWTVSKGAGDNLRSLGYEGEYIIMPNGVDLPRERVSDKIIATATNGYDLPNDCPIYLFVGRMMWYKGIKIIADAMAKLKADGKDFRMVFIGDGTERTEIEAYTKNNNIFDKCIFTGAIRDRQLLQGWYCRADLFLFPSTFDTNGLVVREAAASNLASVLIKNSCAAEGIMDGMNGFIIEENSNSLYKCLANLYNNRSKMHSVGVRAGEELYLSWEDAVKNATTRYQVVIERYKTGRLNPYRKPIEYFFKANGELMDDLGNLLDLREQLQNYIKDTHRFY